MRDQAKALAGFVFALGCCLDLYKIGEHSIPFSIGVRYTQHYIARKITTDSQILGCLNPTCNPIPIKMTKKLKEPKYRVSDVNASRFKVTKRNTFREKKKLREILSLAYLLKFFVYFVSKKN